MRALRQLIALPVPAWRTQQPWPAQREGRSSLAERIAPQRLLLALNSHGKSARGSKVCILGMAYKKDVDDPRESPSFELMKRLQALGAEVSYNDPFIPRLPPMRHYSFEMESQELTPEYLGALDCVLIATDHSCYDWNRIVRHAPLVLDTRNATRDVTAGWEKIWKA